MLLQETQTLSKNNSCDWLFKYAEILGFGEVHFKIDPKTGLKAIIAVHSNTRGPAIGGCRCIPYDSFDTALEDALRLAYMMSYKAAACDLPHGGAKSVIIRPSFIEDREAFFKSFGQFVHELQGQYIAAEDSGTTPADMDIIAKVTPYVTCTSTLGGDPAPYTALGVRRSIQAAVKFQLNRDLNGIHVAIQGVGHVGYLLAEDLLRHGAKVTIADINPTLISQCAEKLDVQVVSPEEIYSLDCDVFSPCALGAILNDQTIPQLKTRIIAGSANNQLAHKQHGIVLHQMGILYAPDFVINSGGLIYASAIYNHGDVQKAIAQIEDLYHTLWRMMERAKAENKPLNEIAETIAKERLGI